MTEFKDLARIMTNGRELKTLYDNTNHVVWSSSLSDGTVLWSGAQSTGDITLATSLKSDWSNVGGGIAVTLRGTGYEDNMTGAGDNLLAQSSSWAKGSPFKISAADLVAGNTVTNTTRLGSRPNGAYMFVVDVQASVTITPGVGKVTLKVVNLEEDYIRNSDGWPIASGKETTPQITKITTYLN